MKVSISWLKELVDLNIPVEKLVSLLPLRSISIKEVTDSFFELDMKGYNRADLLSLRGVAQEAAAIINSNVKFKEKAGAQFVFEDKQIPQLETIVENNLLTPLYTLVKIEGIKVESSPNEWVKKLADSGIRSINNIADLTNLIMLEYGQPMHAFDADKVKTKVSVRVAKKGEKLTTLDGKERILEEQDLVIADEFGPIGLAGVMGGKDSEITNSTTSILLEAAIFDPVNIRKTAQKHNLQSEASKRFQHGLSRTRLLQALDEAIRTYMEYGAKMTAISITGDTEDKLRKIILTKKKLENLVGIKFGNEEVENYLEKLNFKLRSHSSSGNTVWEVEVPYFRLDINIEEDIIEEVARMHGYEKIPAEKVSESKPLQIEDPIFKKISDLRKKLVDLGLTEVQTYSFYSTDVINALEWNEQKKKFLVKIANPISSETEYLRQSIWANLVEIVGKNLRKGFKDIAVFEIGKAFNNINGEPSEDYRLAIALSNETDNPLAELYQIGQNLASHFRCRNMVQRQPPAAVKNLFHPKRFVAFEKDGKQIGGLAEVHLRVLNNLGIEKRVAVLEIEIKAPQ